MISNLNLKNYTKIVVLTGAGISAESGLSTFRDSGGLWDKYPIEEVATPEAFKQDPVKVWTFYSIRKDQAYGVQPNKGHELLAKLINKDPANRTLITQNVDFLHERSLQNLNLFHMHGRLFETKCSSCSESFNDFNIYFDEESNIIDKNLEPFTFLDKESVLTEVKRDEDGLPLCPSCGGILRPDIVWFGEMPKFTIDIHEKLNNVELFITIGTSGNVYPAAGFIQLSKQVGADTLCINMEEIIQQNNVDYFFKGSASEGLQQLLDAQE